MKNVKVWLVFLPLFTIACSDEYASEIGESVNLTDQMKKSDVGAANYSLPIDREDSSSHENLETVNEVNIDSKPVENSQIVQTTTSVVEYSVEEAEEDRRKDKDWETSVTKIAPKGTKEHIALGPNP